MARRDALGFTRIELIAVLGITGVLAAFALPSFHQKACACKGEAPTYTGAMTIAQLMFFHENQRFSDSWDDLQLETAEETTRYRYSIQLGENSAFSYADAKSPEHKSYVAGTFISPEEDGKGVWAGRIICEANQVGSQPIAPPVDFETCGKGSKLYGDRTIARQFIETQENSNIHDSE